MLKRYSLPTREEEHRLVQEYFETKSQGALDKLVESNLPFIRMEASRLKYYAQKAGLEWDDLVSHAVEAFLKCLNGYRHRAGGNFYAYFTHTIRSAMHHAIIKAGLPVSLGQSDKTLSMWAFMNLPRFLKELGYNMESLIPEAVIEQAGQFYRLNPGCIKDLIALKQRWGHSIRIDDMPEREADAIIHAHAPHEWMERRGNPLTPEDIQLAQSPAPKSQQEKDDELVDYRRDKLRDWLMLIPRIENQILLFRYLLPTQLGSSKTWDWAAIRNRITMVKMSKREVESYHNVAINRLRAFNKGDFALVCPLALADQELALHINNAQRTAGDNWAYWLKLFPRTERKLFTERWSTIPPVPLSHLCSVNGGRHDGRLRMTPEQGKQIEAQYIQRFKEFAAGDFSNADSTMLAEELPLELVETLLEKFPRGSLDYLILKKKLLTFQTRKTKTGSGTSVSRGRLEVIADQRLKGLSQEYGRPLTVQEATQLLRRRYVELCHVFCKMAEQEGHEFAAEESARNTIKEVLSYADKEELERILQAATSKAGLKVTPTEKKKIRASLYLDDVGKQLSLDERMMLHRMLKLHSEGLSAYDISSKLKTETKWHPTRLQQFFLSHTTPQQRKLAKENGVKA